MHIQIINFNLAGLSEEQYIQACESIFAKAFREISKDRVV
jgi:hypothetical protein